MKGLFSPWYFQQIRDVIGKPLSNGLLYTFVTESQIPKQIYYDTDLLLPCPNPLPLDDSGFIPQFYMNTGLYTFIIKDKNGITITQRDNITGVVGSTSDILQTSGSASIIITNNTQIYKTVEYSETAAYRMEESGADLGNFIYLPKGLLTEISTIIPNNFNSTGNIHFGLYKTSTSGNLTEQPTINLIWEDIISAVTLSAEQNIYNKTVNLNLTDNFYFIIVSTDNPNIFEKNIFFNLNSIGGSSVNVLNPTVQLYKFTNSATNQLPTSYTFLDPNLSNYYSGLTPYFQFKIQETSANINLSGTNIPTNSYTLGSDQYGNFTTKTLIQLQTDIVDFSIDQNSYLVGTSGKNIVGKTLQIVQSNIISAVQNVIESFPLMLVNGSFSLSAGSGGTRAFMFKSTNYMTINSVSMFLDNPGVASWINVGLYDLGGNLISSTGRYALLPGENTIITSPIVISANTYYYFAISTNDYNNTCKFYCNNTGNSNYSGFSVVPERNSTYEIPTTLNSSPSISMISLRPWFSINGVLK
jgi:hypothetical protein